jgi:hypothetical protein
MQEIIQEFVNYFLFVPALLFIWYAFNRVMGHVENTQNKKLVHNFEHLNAVLTYHMETAYETIHKDNILIYSLEGVKPKEEDIDFLGREFVKLTNKLLGPNMLDTMINLYGDEDNLYTVMLFYFNSKFENDEIRQSAIDSIQNGEEE